MARKFITVTQPTGRYRANEPIEVPVDRILDVVDVPNNVPIFEEGVRAIIRCKEDDYHTTRDARGDSRPHCKGGMMRYRVTWEIDLDESDAPDPKGAAEECLKIMRDPASIATVFVVADLQKRQKYIVDLENDEVKPYSDALWRRA